MWKVFFLKLLLQERNKHDGNVLLILDSAPFRGFAVVSAKNTCVVFGRSFSQIFCPHSYFFQKPN